MVMKKKSLSIRWTKKYREKVVKLYFKYKNAGKVASKLNKFRSSILRILKQEGVYIKPSGKGEGHSQWKGGRGIKSGYWTIYNPTHPRALNIGRVYEHIIVAEKKYNKLIKKREPIHHIDFDRLNNNPKNLYLCKDIKEHMNLHSSLEEVARKLFKQGKLRFRNGKYY